MSDYYEVYKWMKEQRKIEGKENLHESEKLFNEAWKLAKENGLRLRMCSETHYQLRNDKFIMNLYPSNQRIYNDRKRPGPFLKITKSPWTLLDIVKLVVERII